MQFKTSFLSPLGKINLYAEPTGLTGLYFSEHKYFKDIKYVQENPGLNIFKEVENWLSLYFEGKNPKINFAFKLLGTPFQMELWQILTSIPYGKTETYGEIAKKILKRTGGSAMSAQAIGNAISHNKISIIIPCHRVIGSNGNLNGYAGGIDKKRFLLNLENAL